MYRARVGSSGPVVAERLRAAHTHWGRLRGLLGTRTLEPGSGLWLRPCQQVHMLGMRYAVDVVFLDADRRVVRTIAELAPGRFSPKVAEAESVLELPIGTLAATGLREGSALTIDGVPEPPGRLDALGAALLNVLIATFYALFAWAHLRVALRTGQWLTTMPIVLQEALLVVLFLGRRRSTANSTRPFDWAIAILGTFLPLAMRAGDSVGPLVWLGRPVQVFGLGLALVAVAGLGRSIGIVAANRGIKTGGLYGVVRHPLYLAHLVGYLGYVASYPSLRNALIVLATAAAMAARAVVEERLLARDPAYAAYRARVPWRFVPYVF